MEHSLIDIILFLTIASTLLGYIIRDYLKIQQLQQNVNRSSNELEKDRARINAIDQEIETSKLEKEQTDAWFSKKYSQASLSEKLCKQLFTEHFGVRV